ncbi:MAG: acetate/propionate family kinase [Polyangia bacterium]
MRTLAINVGSSSVRLTMFDGDARSERHFDGGDGQALAKVEATPDVVVHRIVHGGPRLRATTVLDDACLRELRANVALAPLHLPRALAWIDAARARWPNARHVAAFDTALYASLPPVATTYALPRQVLEQFGIARYGFHGLAHQSMLRSLGAARSRVISFQLGAGASVTASVDGRAVDTSMGFTPLEGLVMATRPGDVDAGALVHLLRSGMAVEAVDHMLEHESGLRGLAGDGDMRALLARDDDQARLAIAVYVQRARKYLGAYFAVLGGCDAIAFGGGVGENAPVIRAAIVAGFEWAGVVLDAAANGAAGDGLRRISDAASDVELFVTPVDEAAVMRAEAEQR